MLLSAREKLAGRRTPNKERQIMKYQIIGSETQVAATECKCSLSTARRIFKAAKFSNGFPALIVAKCRTKRDAQMWLERSNNALAYLSGRLGRWITPTFVIQSI